jgi:HlyD family secretion protein
MAQLGNLTITSPISGTVTVRSVEPGVVVSPGKTLLTVLDLNTVYLRGFIPQGQIGQVHVGQAAKVFLDSAPDRPFTARVSAIDAEASFTPENIYFKQDRVQQVFGVRLTIEQPDGLAKPGMPADAEIVLEDQGS